MKWNTVKDRSMNELVFLDRKDLSSDSKHRQCRRKPNETSRISHLHMMFSNQLIVNRMDTCPRTLKGRKNASRRMIEDRSVLFSSLDHRDDTFEWRMDIEFSIHFEDDPLEPKHWIPFHRLEQNNDEEYSTNECLWTDSIRLCPFTHQ